MAKEKSDWEKVEEVLREDNRYKPDAYFFILAALRYKIDKLKKRRHITAKELSIAIKELAIKEYGPMAKLVLNSWGVYKTEDFGEIVFNMVEKGLLTKQDKDKKEDFPNLFDFEETFLEKYPWGSG